MGSKVVIYWNLYTILNLIGQLFQKYQNLVILPSEKFHNGCQNGSEQQFFVNFMYKNENKGESTMIHEIWLENGIMPIFGKKQKNLVLLPCFFAKLYIKTYWPVYCRFSLSQNKPRNILFVVWNCNHYDK